VPTSGEVTLLWALRSPCSFACPHCYFGTIAEHRQVPHAQTGELSHLSGRDLPARVLTDFAATLPGSRVRRVIIAGGEPLDWPATLEVVALAKEAGCQVVIATNGVPLTRAPVIERLLALGVDGVSVSLDSADPEINDRLRPSRTPGRFGFHDVLAGIRALRDARGAGSLPRIGIYTVVTRSRPQEITDVARLAGEAGADYYVPQPISLEPDHVLFHDLSHTTADVPNVQDQLADLYRTQRGLALPDPSYIRRFVAAITTQDSGHVPDCFAGVGLFFVQPDGTVWDCPSSAGSPPPPPPGPRRRSPEATPGHCSPPAPHTPTAPCSAGTA